MIVEDSKFTAIFSSNESVSHGRFVIHWFCYYCADVLVVGGTQLYILRGLYEKQSTLHEKNIFLKKNGDVMIWFNGNLRDPDWMFGFSSSIEEEKFNWGCMQSNDARNCPENSKQWTEYSNSEWKINTKAFVRPYSPTLGTESICE